MSYAAAIDRLHQLGQELGAPAPGAGRRKFDLAHMRALTAALGNPQSAFDSVLIAGTNGKGSTAATLASILSAAGYRVGLYTSPHLMRVNERIQVSVPLAPTEYSSADVPGSSGPAHLIPISDDEFATYFFEVDRAASQLVSSGVLPQMPSYFETITAVGFCYFASRDVDIAVLEVGLGGRLDATNVVEPILSVITDIALDHQDYLGPTLADIAREKAGILRSGGTLVTLPQHPVVNQVLGEVAVELQPLKAISAAAFVPSADQIANSGKPASRDADDIGSARPILSGNRYDLTVGGTALHVDSPLAGQHQQRNLALAIAAASELRNVKGYDISNDSIELGIRNVHWPGRLQKIPVDSGREILLDVAHNPAGAWTLRAALSDLPESRPRTLIFSCLRDKDLKEMAQILLPLFDASSSDPNRRADHIIVAEIRSPRAAPMRDLLRVAESLGIPVSAASDVRGAVDQAMQVTPAGGIIVVTGSVYLVGEVSGIFEGIA